MRFRLANETEFQKIKDFYWRLIDQMQEQSDTIGWKKGVYPTDEMLRGALEKKELYLLETEETLCACVILNSSCNEGYQGAPWRIDCTPEEVLIPHALAVSPELQGKGIGKQLVFDLLRLARDRGKKAVRLDILGTNRAAERLYTGAGFQFVAAKNMFYEDTGWTEYRLFEMVL